MTETRPTILLTRPQGQSDAFATALRARIPPSVAILVSPILEVVHSAPDLPFMPDYVILTSAHAAEFAHAANLKGRPAFCVGDRTADAAAGAGLLPRSAGRDADALADLLLTERPAGRGLYLRGSHVASNLPEKLNQAGIDTYSLVVYDQRPRPLSGEAQALLRAPAPVLLPVFSPRSSQLLADATSGARAPIDLIAISAKAARPWHGRVASLTVADSPDAAAMEDAVVERVNARSAC